MTNETDDANVADVKLNVNNDENDDDEDETEAVDDFYENDLLD